MSTTESLTEGDSRWRSAGRADGEDYLRGVRLAAGFFLEASGVCDGTFGVGTTLPAVGVEEPKKRVTPIAKPRV